MHKGNLFVVYKSSAGSGKTFTLTKEYLKLAFHNPDHFKKILAVTFTNKATQEMKERIIQNLFEFSEDTSGAMAQQLKELLNFSDDELKSKSKDLLISILHNYSRFSVQTIDRFFQNVMRSFARELSIQGDGELLLNTDEVRQSVLDLLMEDISDPKHTALKNWVIDFSINKLEEKGKWDIRRDILSFTEELMKDDFKVIERALNKEISNYEKLKSFKDKLNKIIAQFENALDGISKKAFQLIEANGLVITDFSYGYSGAINFFNKINKDSRNYDLTDLVKGRVKTAIETDGESLASKSSKKKDLIFQTASAGLMDHFQEVIDYIKKNIGQYRSAENILKNIYLIGITQQFNQRMQEYKKEEGIQFLSDTTQFLNEIIGTDPAESPFVYEKMGSFYDNFLIDEFQDTSTLQWQNFKPLIENSLAEGNENLVVGDVKQSIYRWRGGDWRLLLKGLKEDISPAFYQEEALSHNFRSKPNVIDFNNKLFTAMPNLVKSNALNKDSNAFTQEVEYLLQDLPDAYKEVVQEKKKEYPYQGFVELQFFEQEENEDGEKISWQTKALEKFVQDLERLQDAGLKLNDVGILVRKKKEGMEIQDFLEHYKNRNPHKLQKYKYSIISDETLLLSSAHIVNFLLNCFQHLYTEDKIALSQIKFYYQKIIQNDESLIHDIVKLNSTDDFLPVEFLASQKDLMSLSLLEMSEQLIQLFQLKKIKKEKAYLSAFQDVLLDFGNKGGIPDFMEWWEENSHSYAIKLQSDENSARLMTIHKSKGLEFKICMIPLLDWTLSPNPLMAPTLWVKTTGTQFSEIPYLPIKHSSSLKESDFALSYWEEEVRSYLDNLNLMYVAMTRAGDALFFNSHAKAKSGYISKLLLKFAEEQDQWEEADMKLIVGSEADFALMAKEKEVSSESFPVSSVNLTYYESHNWHDKLKIKHSSTLLAQDAGLSKTDLGIYVHDIFSKLNDLQELPEILEKVKTEKMLNKEDFEAIQKLVKDNLEKDSILLPWFETDWQVKTEVPVLLEDGSLIRLDRVLINGHEAKILDFKTGLKSDQDHKQVSFYRNTLKKMGYEKVTAHIAYLNPLEIIEV
ncbi:ATP-dependent exoDNAse (exonuclease V) beta subunit (contains helicase and exonuclease domains) [Marivirga sericea]|uniref:DNA 3'-5' helicase n=1 Tax=Marivirga sericea TaxID=1028 RepID=A0A1X7JNR1_9BACT|nr:UvrD-helicase domain-containing protein [Marivirga sericea]SMG29533.1 ATP-dependent exoDNAse (exonuclease V) beta subunit (contains helicase and exonuclease domains) [Marivirga sericea]